MFILTSYSSRVLVYQLLNKTEVKARYFAFQS